MTDTRPPPYPGDTRAKGWRLEIDHERIRQSDTWALATPDVRPWLLMLWMVAWEQTPCGSLPADDALVAARIGMPAKTFQRHRAVLMRGWWAADDGRLYHAVVTLRVQEMLAKRAKDAKRAAENRGRRAASPETPHEVTDESRVTTSGVHPEFDTKHQAPSTGTLPPSEVSPAAPARRPRTRKPQAEETLVPDDFAISEGVRLWAAKNGFEKLEQHLDAFVFKAKAKAYSYADWDAAFKTAVREDWAKLRGMKPVPAGERATAVSSDAERTQEYLRAHDLTPEERARSEEARKRVMSSVKVINKEAA